MTTATLTEADFCPPTLSAHSSEGAQGWSLALIEAPVTDYTLTPQEVDLREETTLSGEPSPVSMNCSSTFPLLDF